MRRLLLALTFIAVALASPANAENAVIAGAIDGFVQAGLRPVPCGLEPTSRRDGRAVRGPVARQARRRAKHVPDACRRVVRGRNHPLRTGDGGKPAGAHPVLAGSQEHRPQAGSGSTCRQGCLGDRSCDAAGTRASPCRGSARSNSCCSARIREALAEPGDPYRCAYGAAIAGNIEEMAGADPRRAGRIRRAFARQWADPGPENPLYRTDAEAMTELFNVFVHGLEMVRDVRLNGFLGEIGGDKPKQADVLALGRDGRLDPGEFARDADAVRRIRPRRAAARRFRLDRTVDRLRVRHCRRHARHRRRTDRRGPGKTRASGRPLSSPGSSRHICRNSSASSSRERWA